MQPTRPCEASVVASMSGTVRPITMTCSPRLISSSSNASPKPRDAPVRMVIADIIDPSSALRDGVRR